MLSDFCAGIEHSDMYSVENITPQESDYDPLLLNLMINHILNRQSMIQGNHCMHIIWLCRLRVLYISPELNTGENTGSD